MSCWSSQAPAVPTIDFTDDKFVAVTAAMRRLIEEDKFPHAPRLDPLRSALAKLEAPSRPLKKSLASGIVM
jgi:hypothetical protein